MYSMLLSLEALVLSYGIANVTTAVDINTVLLTTQLTFDWWLSVANATIQNAFRFN